MESCKSNIYVRSRGTIIVSTREAHEGYIRRTIKPVLGQVMIRKLGADSLDGLYAAPWTSCTCVRLDRPGSSTSCA